MLKGVLQLVASDVAAAAQIVCCGPVMALHSALHPTALGEAQTHGVDPELERLP